MSAFRTPCLCLITDRRQLSPGARGPRESVDLLEAWLEGAIDQVDLIQIREPDLDGLALYALAERLAARARHSGTTIVVNERADIARAAGAGGVHLRSDSASVARVRAISPSNWLIGRSVHDPFEVPIHASADYLIFGTVFPSRSKPDQAGQGLDRLEAAVRATAVPVLAIGGIDPDRASQCRWVGAAGVAAIGLFLPPGRAPQAMGIGAAADALRSAMDVR